MKIDLDSTEPDVRIEVVPLIDVIFCILTFFILAAVTLTRQAAINVDLPRAESGTTQMRQILIVSVDPIGQAYVEKLPVSRDQLYQAIVNFRQQNPEGMMVLYASRAASYNDVVQVLDLLRSAGGDRVALATLPGEGGNPTAPFNPPSADSIDPNNPLNPSGNPFAPSIPNAPGSASPLPGSDDLFDLSPTPQSGATSPSRSGSPSTPSP
jgi:biopolymer transport protein ExbD